MMHGGDLYGLAKILGHANIKMAEGYAKLGKSPREMWKLMELEKREQIPGGEQAPKGRSAWFYHRLPTQS